MNEIIGNITRCPYQQIENVIPDDMDKEKIVSTFEEKYTVLQKLLPGYSQICTTFQQMEQCELHLS